MTYAEIVAETTSPQDRIVVGGVDITWFRGYRTPTPKYALTEPFGYGSASLVLPQVHGVYENHLFGQPGELEWLHRGALVLVQRVGETGTVVATDYRGVVMDVSLDGRVPSLTIGGILSGPASIRDRQPPLYRATKDLDVWMFESISGDGMPPYVAADIESAPSGSKRTGVEVISTGGQTQLDWLQELYTLSLDRDGSVKTIMPMEDGGRRFEFRQKDLTTVHYTCYLDGSRAEPNLSNNAAEHPNVYFATGIEPNGAYWDGSVFPLIEEDEPPPAYGGVVLTEGASGDDVLQANWKLQRGGWLTRADVEVGELDTYTDETTEAVEHFQKWADLPITGNINEATWEALWDVNVKSWGMSGSRIEPIAQADDVRPWSYSGNGALLGRNPKYNEHKLRSDRTIEFGANTPERTGRRWCKGMLARTDNDSYVGTIRLNGVGLIAGQHNYGDPAPTAADVVPIRSLRAGTNLWLPDLQGGTLVHIAKVDIEPATDTTPASAVLTVDPHHRDALELAEVIARRRDSQRSPRRDWVRNMRRSRQVVDSVQPFHKKAGINWQKIPCPKQQWTGFWVFAGYAGELSRLRLVTDDQKAAFVCAIFADKVPNRVLNRRLSDPWTVDNNGETVWETGDLQDWYDQRLLVYSAGDEEQPCGYGRRRHTNNAGKVTDAPITGIHERDASFRYFTGKIPALWVAVWPHNADTVIQRGRILWTALDSGM